MANRQPDNEGPGIQGAGLAFDAAFSLVKARHPRAEELLALAAHLAAGIEIAPETISAGQMSQSEANAAAAALSAEGLATRNVSGGIAVTAEVQRAMRDALAQSGEAPRYVARAVRALTEAYPHGVDDRANWGGLAVLESHVMAVLEHAAESGPDAVATRQLLRQHASYLFARDRHADAEPVLRRAGAIGEGLWGPDHPNGAQDRTDLAVLLNEMGRTEEALPLVRCAIAIDEAALGPEHPLVAERYNILATLLANLGRPAEADPLIRHAVLAAEKSLGPDHADTRLYRDNYQTIIAGMDAIARRDDAVEEGLMPASPERLQRPDIPPPPSRDRHFLDRFRQRRQVR